MHNTAWPGDATYNFNGGYNTVLHQDPSTIPPLNTLLPNGASVLTPGYWGGIEAARASGLANFPLATLIEPAHYFASNGFEVGMQHPPHAHMQTTFSHTRVKLHFRCTLILVSSLTPLQTTECCTARRKVEHLRQTMPLVLARVHCAA